MVFAWGLILVPFQSLAVEVDFVRDIEPILKANCWDCHGEQEQESGATS